jgi:hypothetical protein
MKLIREHNDFDWVNNDNNLNGVKIKTPVGKTVITIIDDGGRTVTLTWGEGAKYSTEYDRKTVESFIARGTWTLTESTDDFDWMRGDIETPLNHFKHLGYKWEDVVGFNVRISENSRFYSYNDEDNPIDEIGFITDYKSSDDSLPIEVKWPGQRFGGSFTNSYHWNDLIVVNRGNNLNESDDFEWIRDIEPGIELKPRTMYYFEPKLTVDEVERFANVISNSDYLKNWMLTKVISRMSGDRQGDNMSYFVTSDSIDELVAGWCLTSNPHSMSRSTYRDYDMVDARNEFNF